jgi:hypothetical protein
MLVRCDRDLFAALSALSRAQLEAELSEILDEGELDGLWARRDLILAHFGSLIADRGENTVLY